MAHNERLLVQLAASEIQQRGEQLAGKIRKLGRLREEKREAAKEYAEKISDLETEIHGLSEEVETGKGYALVEVVEAADLHKGVMRTVRTDTGEFVRSRPLTQAEKEELEQGRLPFAEADPA